MGTVDTHDDVQLITSQTHSSWDTFIRSRVTTMGSRGGEECSALAPGQLEARAHTVTARSGNACG